MQSTTELFSAIEEGNIDTVRGLISTDPSVASAKNTGGISAVMAAMYTRRLDIVQALIGTGITLDIFDASAIGQRSSMQSLLDANNACVTEFSTDGWTALHLAAHFNRPDIVQMLVDHGADSNSVSHNDLAVTPLQSALAASSTACASVLLAAGARTGATPGGSDWTSFHYVAQHGLLQIINELLESDADINARTKDGKTPLAIAEENNQVLVANDLRAHGATL